VSLSPTALLASFAVVALAVFAEARLSERVPMRAVRRIAAALFFLFGAGATVRALGWA
jgi:putative Ca2+/H+ antiporter (TMEM165/GDT1 family)